MKEIDFELEPWAVGLKPNDAEFVREFMVDLNAFQAMQRAGFGESTSQKNGARMIRRPVIARAIAGAMTARAETLGINSKMILAEAFRCYLGAVEDRLWGQARGFLEMMGKHVDVQAFRTQVGIGNPDGTALDIDVSSLSTDEKRIFLAALESRAGIEPAGFDEGAQTIN